MSGNTLKRKNVKGLALKAQPPLPPPEPEKREEQLEIGIEYKLDLKREDLEVLKELGHGNGGTVSKVKHTATGTVMARKVRSEACKWLYWSLIGTYRSYMSRQRKRFVVESCESFTLCTSVTLTSLSTSTAHSSASQTMSSCVWNIWTLG